ncbi:MAG TPA: sugar ABC transporter ATP-binding protein, partial [Blastocatellia bacterium]|nr:sugar ABC transporter ATP-binding protein [Blastocatellia bacterium]
MPTQDLQPLLRLEHITKAFSGVTVLDDVRFDVWPGEVHALIGENGAGKSTLMNIVTGSYYADSGQVFWKGQPVEIRTPHQAHQLGINIVHQELMLVPQLSIGENVFLGRHPVGRRYSRWVRWSEINSQSKSLLETLGHPLDPRRPVNELSIAEQQLVEIARALAFSAELIIMDEPTSSLASSDIQRLFDLIKRLKARNVSVVFIGHRMEEVLGLADRVVVMRDGENAGSLPIEEASEDTIIRLMVGRKIELYPKEAVTIGSPILEVRNLSDGKRIRNVSFTVM